MSSLENLFQPLTDALPASARPFWWLIPLVLALLILLLLGWLLRRLLRAMAGRPRPEPGHERGLREMLAEYPPLTGKPGSKRLTFDGLPVRLRLIVVAPVGKEATIEEKAVPGILNQVVQGLNQAVHHDKPRIRIWPPQLSSQGFAAVFHRLIVKPEPEGKPSRRVLLAGQARIDQKPLLLGLALIADAPDRFSRKVFQPDDWSRKLRFEDA